MDPYLRNFGLKSMDVMKGLQRAGSMKVLEFYLVLLLTTILLHSIRTWKFGNFYLKAIQKASFVGPELQDKAMTQSQAKLGLASLMPMLYWAHTS